MRAMAGSRWVLGAVGVAVAGYGLLRLGRLGGGRAGDVAWWALAGVLAHDAVLAPAVVVAGAVAAWLAPDWLRVPLVRALVVLGPLTLVAVPVLGRFGARPDNPTLLDRPYLAGYLGVVGIVVVVTVADAARRYLGRPKPAP